MAESKPSIEQTQAERTVVAWTRIEPARTWWSLALRGLLAIAAGILVVVHPVRTVAILALGLGAWIFIDGVVALVSTWTQEDRRLMTLPIGLIGIAMGYVLLTRTGTTLTVVFILIAAWAFARGIAEIGVAAAMRGDEPGRGSLVFLGILSAMFGVMLVVAPAVGVVLLASWIGIYAFVYGAIELVRAVRVHREISSSQPHAA
jgi:uncharacterized membrane protein HdeD (DUF308 family)